MRGQVAGSERFSCAKSNGGVGDVVLAEQLAESCTESAAVYNESFVFRGGQKIIDSGLHGTWAGCSVVDEATTFLQPDVLPKPEHAFLHKCGVFSCAEIGDFLLVYISGARVWLYRSDGEKFHVRCEVNQALRVIIQERNSFVQPKATYYVVLRVDSVQDTQSVQIILTTGC
jgi:hypothetical protein